MKRSRTFTVLFLVGLIGWCLVEGAQATTFRAYSLKEAERRIRYGGTVDSKLAELGGMTRIAGLVYDERADDLILVGQAQKDRDSILLDDLVVALRALLVHGQWPLVSIDKDTDTLNSGNRVIRYEGGIENSRFGEDFLKADVTLKKMSLDLLPTSIWGIQSYYTLAVDDFEKNASQDAVSSRFWFDVIGKGSFAVREGVFAINGFRIGVHPQIISVNGEPVPVTEEIRDEFADRFATAVTDNLADLSAYYPEIGRLRVLFELVSLAKGIQSMSCKPGLDYFLYEFPLARHETPAEFMAMTRTAEREVAGVNHILRVEGGVEVRALITRVLDGDVTALRDIVLKTRPSSTSLTWELPLHDWRLPGSSGEQLEELASRLPLEGSSSGDTGPGCYVSRSVGAFAGLDPGGGGFVPPRFSRFGPQFELVDRLPSLTCSPDIGGVMLQGSAMVEGAGQAEVDLSSGNFSLIVDGENARLDPEVYQKFNTALWSVYFGETDPGISIDPIAPGIDKHLVRYIGRVINTDLGRVMREADYLMKMWAVGTERPDIRGFRCVDDLTARHGLRYVGASRRFWFVPEDMRFRSGNGMLLFDGGRMTCRTEYVFQDKGYKAEPADKAFADFFTEHYQEIAERYPVYEELFDYAKMVSLAKYLKESRVPLLWYLMANRDLILTEDSPGTVDALARGSAYFEGMEIEGGVDLGFDAQYVYDHEAMQAISESYSGLNSTAHSISSLSSSEDMRQVATGEPFSFALEDHSYSVIPQHSLTSGRDRRGIRYQTDLAFRRDGEPGLELVRYFNARQQTVGEFGRGWHLLIPYQIKPQDSTTREFLNAIIPEQMVLENLLTGEQEVLTFSTDRYSIAGYVPQAGESSLTVGLFLMSDASYRLADKLGNEFWFDQAGYLTDMILSEDYRLHFDYHGSFTDAFDESPYRVQRHGDESVDVLNAQLPKTLVVDDIIYGDNEVFVFSDTSELVGYVPENSLTSRFEFLAVLSDGSFRLLDNAGNENAFDAAGDFVGAILSPERPMIASMTLGEQKVDFKYEYDRSGQPRIASAHYSTEDGEAGSTYVVTYEYDDVDRLCRVMREGESAGS